MAKFKLIVFSDPVGDRDAEYNDWYTNRHLADVVAVPGFTAAQRFKLNYLQTGEFKHRYLAIYDIEADDPAKVMSELNARAGTDAMVISEALDSPTCDVAVFEEISACVTAPATK